MIARILAFALTLALVTPAIAAGDDDPHAYEVHVPIGTASGSSLQRLNLPARVLVASRSAALADVRVFNGQGKAVPIALSAASAPQHKQSVSLAVMPILGAADALAVTGVSLRIDNGQRASVVRVDGSPQAVGGSTLLGVLLDTRWIADPVSALSLDLATPAGQPVTFTIETSVDLQDWEPLAEQVVYRAGGQAGVTTFAFADQDLRGHYLRVTWQATSRLLSSVVIRSASAVTIHSGGGAQPLRAVLTVPASSDRHAIEFTLPFAMPLAALEIQAGEDGTVIPVRILGRDQNEQPWTPIATGSVFRVTGNGQQRANPAFDLHGTRFRTLRIEADARTAGFLIAPKLAAQFEPVQIVFLASGPAPFTVSAGRADAAPAFLAARDLAQAYGVTGATTLPVATTVAEADPEIATIAPERGTPWRRFALWTVLFAGTALLAAMVWLLARRSGRVA